MSTKLDAAVLSRVVRARAAAEPDRLALVFENGTLGAQGLSLGQLAVRGNLVAAELRRRGLRRGDRVAVMLRNNPEFVDTLIGASALALTTVPIEPTAGADRLEWSLRFAECAGLVTADYIVADPEVAEAIRSTGVTTWVVSSPEGRAMGLDPGSEWPLLNEALDRREAPDVGEHVEDVAEPWLLAFSSEPSADPDALELGHDRMLLYRRLPELFGYRPDDVCYTGLSLSHADALLATLMPALWGVVDHAVLSRWWDRTRLWDVCIEHGVTTWSNASGMATAVYSEPSSERDRAHSVRLVVSTGMPREIWRPFEERFGVKVVEWYGTMEGGFACNPVGVGPIGSFGKPPADVLEMDVVDQEGRSVGSGQVGELVLRPVGGPVRLTYWRNPEASARRLRNGWLRTGEMVARDAAGWLYRAHRTSQDGGLRRAGELIPEGLMVLLAEDPEPADVFGIP